MLPVNGPAASALPYTQPYDLPYGSQPQRRGFQDLSAVSSVACLVVREGISCRSNTNNMSPDGSEPAPPPPSSSPESLSARTLGASQSSWQRGSSVAQNLSPGYASPGRGYSKEFILRRYLRQWLLCGWASSCSSQHGDGGSGSSGGGSRSKPQAGPGAQQQMSRSLMISQAATGSSYNSLGGPSRKSNTSAGRALSATGPMGGANSSGGSANSHLGPLPTQRLQDVTEKDAPSRSANNASSAALMSQPPHAVTLPVVVLPPQGMDLNNITTTSGAGDCGAMKVPLTFGVPSTLNIIGTSNPGAVAGSCTSSVASYTSGTTTTSRPSRWGLLAGIISAGLRSLSQLDGIVEPDTGNLSREAVYDLTRRASRFDLIRAAGQVFDLSLVGSGSMGLVYRGRITDGSGGSGCGGHTVCVKYLVARGTDGMAAPATEGLLSRALAHPNIISTFSWYITRVTSENFLDFPDALAVLASQEQQCRENISIKRSRGHSSAAVGKNHRMGGNGGGSGGCLRPSPAAVAAPAAAAFVGSGLLKPSLSAAMQPTTVLGLTGNTGEGGDSSTGCNGSSNGATGTAIGGIGQDSGCKGASRVKTAKTTISTSILDMVRSSGIVPNGLRRTPSGSSGGGSFTRLSVRDHRSFTGAPVLTRMGTQREAAVATQFLRASEASSIGRYRKSSAPPPAVRPLLAPPVPTTQEPQQQEQLSDRCPSRTGYDIPSKSVRRAEDFYRSSDMTSFSILQQAATCGAAASIPAMGPAATGVGAGPVVGRRSGTTASLFSRDSISNCWFTPSPNPSNHTPAGGSLPCHTSRSTLYGSAGGGGFGAAGENSLMLGTAFVAMSPVGLQPSSGPLLSGSGGPGGGGVVVSGGRCRSTLVRTGSRLQFSTTPNTHPSIPEDTQEDLSLYGGETSLSYVVPSGPRGTGLRLLSGLLSSGEAVYYGTLPSFGGGGGKPPHVAAVPPGLPLPPAIVAAASAIAESSMRNITTSGNDMGPGPNKSMDEGSILSACFLAAHLDSLKPLGLEQIQRTHVDSGPRYVRTGLLSAVLAPSGSQGQGQGKWLSRGHVSSNGIGSEAASRSVLAAAHSPSDPYSAAVSDTHQPCKGGGGGGSGIQSRIASTVPSRSTNTTSTAKRYSSTVIFPNLTRMLTAAVPGGRSVSTSGASGDRGLGTGTGISSGFDWMTPSCNPLSPTTGASCSAPDGVVSPNSNNRKAGPVTVPATVVPPLPAAAAVTTTARGEGEWAQPEALERGWRTLQQIMRRLNAKPGDYLTRIVMEDADQGSLLGAIKSGRFGVDGERFHALLLTSLDIAHGMAFLHKHNIIHGDLKPSNVLLCSDPSNPRGFIAKVSDFGLSRVLVNRDHDFVQNREAFPAGTVRYLAPEAMSGASFKASDVWSFAVVLWQLATGTQAPWPGLRSMQIIMGIMQDELRLQVPPSVYPPLGQLIESCLSYDHKSRPTFDDIIGKLQAMLRDTESRHTESQLRNHHSASANWMDDPPAQSSVAPLAEPPSPVPVGDLLAATELPCSGNPVNHTPRESLDSPQKVTSSRVESAASSSATIAACEPRQQLELAAAAAPAAPDAAFLSVFTTAAGLSAFAPVIAFPFPHPAIASAAIAAPVVPTAATAAVVAMSPIQSCSSDGRKVNDVDETQIHIAEPESTSESSSGPGSGSESRPGSESCMLATTSDEHNQPRRPIALTQEASGRGVGGRGPGSLNTGQCSLAATSVTLTAAASSSNALTQMSSSWAHTATNTTTITTLGGTMLDCDPRVAVTASAWNSSAVNLGGSAMANTSNSLVRVGVGSASSSGLHSMSRAAMVASSVGATGGGSNAEALAVALERQCLQEMHGRSRTYLGALLPDELCSSVAGRGGGCGFGSGSGHQLPVQPAIHTDLAVGGSVTGVAGGGGGAAGAELNWFSLPPVHEEQPPTSDSGLQTIVTHGSGLSSSNTQLSVPGAAPNGGPGTGDRRVTGRVLSNLGSTGYSRAEASLPRMLQAGLIVLGARESAGEGSAMVQSPSDSKLGNETATSFFGGPAAQRQVQRRAVASLESLPRGSQSAFSRLSGRID